MVSSKSRIVNGESESKVQGRESVVRSSVNGDLWKSKASVSSA